MAQGQRSAERESTGFANVAEQTRLGYLRDVANQGLADDILGQRSAGGQPQSSAANSGVNSGSAQK